MNIRVRAAIGTLLIALISVSTHAQCMCPNPRPMDATATSGVVTINYKEEFVAEKKMPSHVEVIFVPNKIIEQEGLVGNMNEIVERMESQFRAEMRGRGITSTLSFRLENAEVDNLTGSGFRFLDSKTLENNEGERLTISAYGRATFSDNSPPKPGVFEAQIQIRARVCVEADNVHLTFRPKHRRQMRPVLPDSANIPDNVLQQKKDAFDRKVQAEIDRVKDELQSTRTKLSEDQSADIRNNSGRQFEVSIPLVFFGERHDLPVRVNSLRQTRICSSTIGQ